MYVLYIFMMQDVDPELMMLSLLRLGKLIWNEVKDDALEMSALINMYLYPQYWVIVSFLVWVNAWIATWVKRSSVFPLSLYLSHSLSHYVFISFSLFLFVWRWAFVAGCVSKEMSWHPQVRSVIETTQCGFEPWTPQRRRHNPLHKGHYGINAQCWLLRAYVRPCACACVSVRGCVCMCETDRERRQCMFINSDN